MAGLIVEIEQKGLNLYFPLEQPKLTIGRALDNDIILSDITVSPHHCEIELSDNQLPVIRNLSDENRLKVNRQEIKDSITLDILPVTLELGHVKAQILSTDAPAQATRKLKCQSFMSCLLQHPISVTLIFIALLIFEALSYINAQTMPLKGADLILKVIGDALGIFLGALLLSLLTRIVTHRWEIISSIAIISLLFLSVNLTSLVLHVAAYTFNDDDILNIGKKIVIILFAGGLLWFYLRAIAHIKRITAIAVTALISILLVLGTLSDTIKIYSDSDHFTTTANYNHLLLPWDIRLKPTISIDDFTSQALNLSAGKIISSHQ